MKRYLITTADERSWKFDRPVLFLGEWCRLYGRRHVWSGMDAIVAEPYGLKVGQKERDITYIQTLSSQLLCEMVDALNAFHNTHHGLRYWHIVIGPWLQRYVAATFNRYFTLEQALKAHELLGTTVFDFTDYSLATTDYLAFSWACNDDVWNHVLYAKILSFWGYKKIELDFMPLRSIRGFAQEGNHKFTWRRRAVRFVLNNILPKFSRNRDAFISNSYLPLIEEVKLQISLGQCPQLWQSPELGKMALDLEKRQRFSIDAENYTGFDRFVRIQLNEIIPICYLEGYNQLVKQVKSLPWPTEPMFIFTSVNFSADEIFKVWTGGKVEEGSPYFIGQHGNNYGTLIGNPNWPELVTCDKFLTWGWTNGNSKNLPAFVFKTAGLKPLCRVSDGGLLLVETFIPIRTFHYDVYVEHEIYQNEQFRFVTALPEAIQQQLTVRLRHHKDSSCWSDEQRWKARSPQTRIENDLANIWEMIAQSRLVVFSFDSSGILENLALNIPTMCFWHGGFHHLLPGAKAYYELLRGAGIIADSPEQAAENIAFRWDNISEWWGSKEVQNARKAFCGQYARTEKHPVRVLKKLLINNAKRT